MLQFFQERFSGAGGKTMCGYRLQFPMKASIRRSKSSPKDTRYLSVPTDLVQPGSFLPFGVHDDRLGFQVILQPFKSHLLTQSAFLEPSKRQIDLRLVERVDPRGS